MTKVYGALAWYSYYLEPNNTHGVFSSRALAKAHIEKLRAEWGFDHYIVVEWEVDETV